MRYVDLSSALNHFILLFRKKILKPPPRIFLIGFNEINPQYKKLLKRVGGTTLRDLSFRTCLLIYQTTTPMFKR